MQNNHIKSYFMLKSLINSYYLLLFICFIGVIGCAPVTTMQHNIKTQYFPDYNNFLGVIAEPYREELKEQKDGALIIADGGSALLHRLAFIQMAQKSIDIQTYIYKDELTSKLLAHELYMAANRGVKIRILVDDNGVPSNLQALLLLNKHENIDIRIFHPYLSRIGAFRVFEALFSFTRMNKRMHNKLFIFDDTALIVGGRNIADMYFDNAKINFTDTDILFLGNVAKDAKLNFEEFWNYKRSIPANLFFTKNALKKYAQDSYSIDKQLKHYKKKNHIDESAWQDYLNDIEAFKNKYHNKEFKIVWGEGAFLADLPQKVDQKVSLAATPILEALYYNFNQAKDSILISSSYFVPGEAAMDIWHEFVEQRGLKIKVLTNSLASTDVVTVYSHWQKYRDKLALMGIEVYEYPSLQKKHATLKNKSKFYRSSKGKVSLHSKHVIIDESMVAVGSFNLDYRSAMLNTESIVFFKSHELAKELKHITEAQMQESYQIVCDKRKKECHWEVNDDGKVKVFKNSPHATVWQRFFKSISLIMPEKLL